MRRSDYALPPSEGTPTAKPPEVAPRRRSLLGVLLILSPFLAIAAVTGFGWYQEWSKPDPRLCKYCAELLAVENRTDADSMRRTRELMELRAKRERGRIAFDAARLPSDSGVSVVTCPGCQKAGYGKP